MLDVRNADRPTVDDNNIFTLHRNVINIIAEIISHLVTLQRLL